MGGSVIYEAMEAVAFTEEVSKQLMGSWQLLKQARGTGFDSS